MAARTKINSKQEEPVKKAKKKLSAPLFQTTGQQDGEVSLSEGVFGVKPNKVLLAQAVRVYLARQRSAQADVKTRSEVNKTTKKLYRQKGTGGARHGARSAPLFVGGGSAHGPKANENYELSLSKKMARAALLSALSDKAKSGKIILADIEGVEPKTKTLNAFLRKTISGPATIVHAGSRNLLRAARNLGNVEIERVETLNTYQVLNSKTLVLTKEALGFLEKKGAAR